MGDIGGKGFGGIDLPPERDRHVGNGAGQRADLVAFLECLTDDAFLTNPNLTNPWSTP
jgi:hypothetical protein